MSVLSERQPGVPFSAFEIYRESSRNRFQPEFGTRKDGSRTSIYSGGYPSVDHQRLLGYRGRLFAGITYNQLFLQLFPHLTNARTE